MENENIIKQLTDNPNDIYLIAEIGINHNGEIDVAKKLIDASYACNWDCVKFQKRNPEVCVPEDQKLIKRDTPWGEMTYIEYTIGFLSHQNLPIQILRSKYHFLSRESCFCDFGVMPGQCWANLWLS